MRIPKQCAVAVVAIAVTWSVCMARGNHRLPRMIAAVTGSAIIDESAPAVATGLSIPFLFDIFWFSLMINIYTYTTVMFESMLHEPVTFRPAR